MNDAIRIIHEEHRSISAVLSGLKSLAAMAQDPSVRPDFAAFRAMIYYIDAFPERLHHPKEDDQLFSRLVKRDPGSKPLIEALRGEHVAGATLVRELEHALLAFEQSWPEGAREFSDAVDRYARFHWDHMRKEEKDLLPRCEKALTPEDWQAVASAFAGNEDPIADLRDQDFRRLYQKILSLAPAPVGLGPRWQRT